MKTVRHGVALVAASMSGASPMKTATARTASSIHETQKSMSACFRGSLDMTQETISREEYLNLSKPKNKFFATRTEVDGRFFDSAREAAHYRELLILERCGHIKNLEMQVPFRLIVNEQLICTWVADFRFFDMRTGEIVIEDVKSKATKTPLYQVKKKLFRAIYGREVKEVF